MDPRLGVAQATPGVRIKDLVDAFGDNGRLESICDLDFSPGRRAWRISDSDTCRMKEIVIDGGPAGAGPRVLNVLCETCKDPRDPRCAS